MPGVPVLIANYESLVRDFAAFGEDEFPKFDLVVLDEAQRIKNKSSTTSQIVRSVSRTRSWAMTGTPVENSPEDLVGIFEFLSPGFLRTDMQAKKMGLAVKDHILRRTKDMVLTDMPPKMFRDAEVDSLCDIWAFGVIYYEFLTGRFPFDSVPVLEVLAGRAPAAARPQLKGVPADLAALVARCLSAEPADRPTAEALVAAFAAEGLTVVFSTHNLGQAKRLSNRVLYLEAGRLLADLPTDWRMRESWTQQQGDACAGEGRLEDLAPARHADGELGQEPRAHKQSNGALLLDPGPPEEQHRGGQDQAGEIEIERLVEIHGSFLQTVWLRSNSKAKRMAPGTTKYANNSS